MSPLPLHPDDAADILGEPCPTCAFGGMLTLRNFFGLAPLVAAIGLEGVGIGREVTEEDGVGNNPDRRREDVHPLSLDRASKISS